MSLPQFFWKIPHFFFLHFDGSPNFPIPEEPHAPQIKRDDELRQDVGGAIAGPFNEGEELKLLCEVHGGRKAS